MTSAALAQLGDRVRPLRRVEYDRLVDAGALYAEAGVPEYWIVDTSSERVEVHSEIVGGVYGRVTPYGRADLLTSIAVPALQLKVDEIFR
jgi:Uma2 family endonuclease